MKSLDHYWYSRNIVSLLLLPLSWLFMAIVALRRGAYRLGLFSRQRLSVPVIIVGNISVGGTGKTPLTAWLVDCLQRHGLKPGIVSRGYKGRARDWPQQVYADSDPLMVGDEAVLLAQRCHCPVVVGPARVRAAQVLLEQAACNVLIADDGLQHYQLARDVEIAVVDGKRRFGNGRCLPAGPLREPVGRLRDVDFVIVNNGPVQGHEYAMRVRPGSICRLNAPDDVVDAATLATGPVHAVAGIGHPQQFFDLLSSMGFDIIPHPFPDHFDYRQADIRFADDYPVIMTEKDAVKCRRFAEQRHWYLPIAVDMDPRLEATLMARVDRLVQYR